MSDDEAAIRELIAGYALALDGGDIDACVQLFTADAEFLVYGRSFAGHEAIAKMFTDAPRGLHLTGVSRIDIGSDTATALAGPVRPGRRPAPAAGAVRPTRPPGRPVAFPATQMPIRHQPRPVRQPRGAVIMSVALVTGAAGGQGWAIAKKLRAAGYSVAACDRRADAIAEMVAELGDGQVIAIDLDVTSEQQWLAAVETTAARLGPLTVLVNNAGVLHRATLSEESVEDFENAWRVNCLGAFLGMRATLKQLRQAEHGAIVNICSTGAIRPFPAHTAYGSSKWALRGMIQTAAAELAPSGIRVNAVFPGPIATSMLDDATQARLTATATFGRLGQPTEIADAVAFLVSEQVSFITGAELVVDGGQCLQIR